MPAQAPPTSAGGVYRVNAQVTANQATGLPLAGWWTRFAGIVVDGILFGIIEAILNAIFSARGLVELIIIVLELAYVTYFWTSTGSTLGQMLVGIKVVDKDSGHNLKPSQAVVRWIGLIISGIPIFLGYIWAAFDPQKQGWMDKLANTQVVKTR